MNHDKAREYFSAHFEGLLEPGLKQTFEARLRSDAMLQADYAAFVETMGELDTLPSEEIERPVYLSDRIATRIDLAAGSTRRAFSTPVFGGWVRGFGLAALAVLAIGGGILSLNARGGKFSQGGFAGNGPAAPIPVDQLEFSMRPQGLVLSYLAGSSKTLVLSSGTNGRELRRFALDGNRLESNLGNNLQNPALFELQVLGEPTHALVSVPGRHQSTIRSGAGQIKDLAAAISAYYRTPVVVEVSDSSKPVNWNFTATDSRVAASEALSNLGYSVDRRAGGILMIMDR